MRWVLPSGLAYKLNVDATVFKGIKASGIGAVIRNENGEVMVAMAGRGKVLRYRTARKLRR